MQTLLPVAALAFVMGIAIQRGSTCAVLAVEELMRHHRVDRFLGFFECGLWAALALAAFGLQRAAAVPWSPFMYLLGGAGLFGVGAAINGACAFGTIARIGNGRLDYLLTGVAAYAGVWAMSVSGGAPAPASAQLSAPGLTPLLALGLLAGVMALRWRLQRRAGRQFAGLGLCMATIGAVGALVGALHQPWPSMNALAAFPDIGFAAVAGLLALIGGAVAGGVVGGQFRVSAPSAAGVRRRICGGVLMGAGISLVPGGNDALILVGVPKGDIQAILGYLTMLVLIALTLRVTRGVAPPCR